MLSYHDDRIGKQPATGTYYFSCHEFIFCMQLVTVGLLKGKNLLIVVDEHNHHFGDFSSMIAMTIQQTETTLLPFGH